MNSQLKLVGCHLPPFCLFLVGWLLHILKSEISRKLLGYIIFLVFLKIKIKSHLFTLFSKIKCMRNILLIVLGLTKHFLVNFDTQLNLRKLGYRYYENIIYCRKETACLIPASLNSRIM